MTTSKLSAVLTLCLALGGAVVSAPALAAPVNLVTNGGFESVTTFTPDASLASIQYVGENSNLRPSNGGGSPALSGWTTHTVIQGIVLFKSGYQPVAGGNYAIQFESYLDNISQTLQTVAGHQYLLSYDLSAYQDTNQWPSYVQVRLNGVVVDYSDTVSTNSYVAQQYAFTATGTTLLEFWSIGAYPQLDNVSVVDLAPEVVPEPGSLALISLAFAGLSLARRRKT